MTEPEEEGWEPLVYRWLFRSTGDNLDLQLVSEVVGGSLVGLSP